jgi:hypothetical protein
MANNEGMLEPSESGMEDIEQVNLPKENESAKVDLPEDIMPSFQDISISQGLTGCEDKSDNPRKIMMNHPRRLK